MSDQAGRALPDPAVVEPSDLARGPGPPRIVRLLPPAVSVIVGALGVTTLIGWAVGSRDLTSVVPSLPTMKVNTALAFTLTSLMLALQLAPTRARRRVAMAAAGVVALFGFLTLAEWVGGRSLGIDQLLFHDSSSRAGRPTELTAIAFLLLGVMQLTLDAQRPFVRRVHRLAGCGFAVTVLVAAVGYMYGAHVLTDGSGVPGMAVTTMAGLVLVLAAVIAQRPEQEPGRRLRGPRPGAVMLRRLVPAVLIVTPLLGVLRALGQDAGWYDFQFGVALFTASMIVVFLGLGVLAATAVDRHDGDRRLAAEATRRSELRFRALASMAPVGIFESTDDGTIIYANRRVNEISGWTGDELNGGFLQAVHPEDRRRISLAWNADAALSGETEIEFRLQRPDRTEALVIARRAPIRDRDGHVTGFLGMLDDVTALRQADLAARDSEERFRLLAENSRDVIRLYDADRIISYASPSCATVLGYTPEELVGHHADEFQHPDDRARVEERRETVAAAGGEVMLAYRSCHKSGSYVWLEANARTLRENDSGAVIGYQEAARDITQRKHAEQELRQANVELESANRAKSQFFSSMSHELRTPLNAVLGFTGTLLMGLHGPLTEEQKTPMRTVQHTGKHLLSLINDLLDLARIESGKMELHAEQVDCRGLLDEVAVGLRTLADEKGLALEVLSGAEPVQLLCDRRAVSQIVINLTTNAIKFTDAGSVRIELDQRSAADRRVTRFAVIDTGCGIAPADQGRLFAAFEQVARADSRPLEGTGLGLHISQTLAGLLGGEITFESVPGEGSTFALELTEAAC